ncbi:MAG: lysozyme [Alphaproteobacteria bacterium]
MQISQRGLELVKSFEGYHTALPDGSCKAYLDTLAKPPVATIGWGCTKDVKLGMIWTREQAEAALLRELDKHAAIVNRLVTVEIGQNNFDALCSFSYNTGGLEKSTLLKKLNRGDFDGAAREFDRWIYAGGKAYKGLIRRRAAERALFEEDAKDDLPAGEPQMPQRVEAAPAPPSRITIATASGLVGSVMAAIATTKEGVGVAREIQQMAPAANSFVWPAVIVASAIIGVAFVMRWRR